MAKTALHLYLGALFALRVAHVEFGLVSFLLISIVFLWEMGLWELGEGVG